MNMNKINIKTEFAYIILTVTMIKEPPFIIILPDSYNGNILGLNAL